MFNKYGRSFGSFVKSSTFRHGSYKNRFAGYGVTVYSRTGKKDYFFTSAIARKNAVRRFRAASNFKSVRYFKY